MNCNDYNCRNVVLTGVLVITCLAVVNLTFYMYMQNSIDSVIVDYSLSTERKESVDIEKKIVPDATNDRKVSCKANTFYVHEPLHYNITLDRDLLHKCQSQQDNAKKNNTFTGLIFNNGKAYVKTKCGLSGIRHVSTLPHKLIMNGTIKDNLTVPNIVHYVWLGCQEFLLYHYFSIISTYKFIQPHLILLHGDCLPKGRFWTKVLSEVPNLYHVHEDRLISIQGQKPGYIQHEADIIRLQILLGMSECAMSKYIILPLDKIIFTNPSNVASRCVLSSYLSSYIKIIS